VKHYVGKSGDEVVARYNIIGLQELVLKN